MVGEQFISRKVLFLQDTVLKKTYKSVGNSKVAITQKIPQGKLYLVPTPCIKISKVGVLGPDNVAHVQHDALARQSSGGICIYGGEDKRFKLKAICHSKKGYDGTIRSKIYKGGILHSVSASGTPTAPTVSVKSRLGKDAKTKLSSSMKSGLLSLVASQKTIIDGTNKMTAKATISTSLQGRPGPPQIQLGVKVEV